MRRSLVPFIFLGLYLPTWPTQHPTQVKPHPKQLPTEVLQLIPGIGPIQANRLQQGKDWTTQPGIGPKTTEKLLKVLSR